MIALGFLSLAAVAAGGRFAVLGVYDSRVGRRVALVLEIFVDIQNQTDDNECCEDDECACHASSSLSSVNGVAASMSLKPASVRCAQ